MTLVDATPSLAGTLRFIRYGFMPDRLRYRGGDDNRTLFEYGTPAVTDAGLQPLRHRFTGALPYPKLIAHSMGIADPFDSRVVEAYWLGNELLERVEVRTLYHSMRDRFGKQLHGRVRDLVLGKAPAGARPHRSFHVLDVHSRVGELPASIQTLESCRVSCGRVVPADRGELIIERSPLTLRRGTLARRAATRTSHPADRWSWVCGCRTGRRLGVGSTGAGCARC
jgi:hypothetical protein